MSFRCPRLFTCAALGMLALGSSCSRTPIGPESATTNVPPIMQAEVTWTAFGLVDGILTAQTSKGDTLTGQYTGHAFVSSIGQTAVLSLQISGGTGAFAAATGTLTGAGGGSFVDDGPFSVMFQGTIAAASGPWNLRLAVRGDSVLSCASTGRARVTQSGDGTASGSGRLTATLQHEVTNTACGA